MGLRDLLIFTGFGVLFRLLCRERWRGPLLLAASALAIYWLQPLSPIRNLDFWFPTATLALAVLAWLVTAAPEVRGWRANLSAAGILLGVVLLVALTRYLSPGGVITPSRPPDFGQVLIALAVVLGLLFGVGRWKQAALFLLGGLSIFLIVLLVILKQPEIGTLAAAGLRSLMQQNASLANATELRWLGFSYVAFRLIHTLRDRQSGRLPAVGLQDYLIYVIFFPSFTAGPIDRLERFLKDLRKPLTRSVADFGPAFERIASGLFKKFVVADGLALMALNTANAAQLQPGIWTWVVLYAYALQIFFDFSGYTDLAIGIGRLLGINLPENFNRPYLKQNLTLFWNNWHMTLTQWFRAYYFNPVTRWLRGQEKPLPVPAVILLTQVTTFVLIGLWHGMTWNFVIWGAWHGLGLFVQNRYSDWAKSRWGTLEEKPRLRRAVTVLGTLATFNYVALGWVWFALPTPALSVQVFSRLFGGSG